MKKIGFVILALVLVLGSMGLGYAMWSQTITVNGQVNTGNVLVGIRDRTPDTGGTAYGDLPPAYNQLYNGYTGTIFPANSNYGTVDPIVQPFFPPSYPSSLTYVANTKNVASFLSLNNGTFLFHGTGYPNPGDDNVHDYYSFITDNIVNAYPFYAPGFSWVICNGGSLPVKINTVTVTDSNNVLGTVVFYWEIFLTGTTTPHVYGHGTISDLFAVITSPHYQIEKGQQLYISGSMVFLESTPQSTSGSFSIAINAAQWNEVP